MNLHDDATSRKAPPMAARMKLGRDPDGELVARASPLDRRDHHARGLRGNGRPW